MRVPGDNPRVSVIIPAFRAAATILDTIASLRAQTFAKWEAIIVDDGSPDETAELVVAAASADDRVRVLRTVHGGVSAARNEGIARAIAPWLLFLDADDTIDPAMLGRMFEAIDANVDADAVVCGWRRIARDGTPLEPEFPWLGDDAFATFAKYCAVLIHTCVVKRERVLQAGGFDESLATCEDWDLWLRIARLGVRWITVPEVLVEYRHREGSLTTRTRRLWADAQRVLATAYGPDVRVTTALRDNAAGRPADELGLARMELACWAAGMLIASGDEAKDVPEPAKPDGPWRLVESDAARSLFGALVHGMGGGPDLVARNWRMLLPRLAAWLETFEATVGVPGIARRIERRTETLVAAAATDDGTFGRTRVETIDVARPIPDFDPHPGGGMILRCRYGGTIVGTIDLPLPDGRSGSREIGDAIAHNLGWKMLGVYFGAGIYRDVKLRPDEDRLTAWRGGVRLAPSFAHDTLDQPGGLHDLIGWLVLLQELWDDRDANTDAFYLPTARDTPGDTLRAGDEVIVEAGAGLPWLEVNGEDIRAVLTIGGTGVTSTRVMARDGLIPPSVLRAALTTSAGLGLSRAAARHALVGRPLDPVITLHERLAAGAASRRNRV
jgi:GT2 family glycosyltransferase